RRLIAFPANTHKHIWAALRGGPFSFSIAGSLNRDILAQPPNIPLGMAIALLTSYPEIRGVKLSIRIHEIAFRHVGWTIPVSRVPN
ncbi:MAG: hypothetical protein OEY16_13280, partial [Alphaproteobacteria bacterium]|nr:hypothetical protein [Alphaproteobacteria bacterium]